MSPRSSVKWRSGPWSCALRSPKGASGRNDRGSSMRFLKEVRNLMGSYHVKSGIYHFYRNEFKQEVDFFMKALKDEPTVSESDRRTARFFLTQTFIHSAEKQAAGGDLAGAARDYVRASEVSPEFPDIRYSLGQTYEAMGRVDEAIAQY